MLGCFSPLGRLPRLPPAVALPFDELTDGAGHVPEQQTHRNVRESDAEDDGRGNDEKGGDG